jgi:hypothetical protein
MKASRLSSICAAALLFALPAFAGNGNTVKKSLQISETVNVQGTQLTPGTYKFEWSGSGPDLQVSIYQHNDKLTTVPAHLVQESASHDETGYALKPGANGEKNLSEIFFSGEKYDVELQSGASTTPSGGSPSR